MAKKEADKHQPRSLTSSQRMFVDQLVARFGENHTNVKRADLKVAAKELLSTSTAPGWITRNMSVRSKTKRGRYNLAALLKLPIDAFGDTPKGKKKTKKKVAEAKTPIIMETVDAPEKPKKAKSIKAALAVVAQGIQEAPETVPEE
jgi:hypothetical protein